MFGLSQPVKVARTQRRSTSQSPVSVSVPPPPSHPLSVTDMDDAMVAQSNLLTTPTVFLSGSGRHLCWLVDENSRFLRVWDVASPHWERTKPRMVEVPYFAAAREGLPLFVSEMDSEESSLALCSERGAISSVDHSVEFQLLDGDETVTATCFTCIRRGDCGPAQIVLTAVGASDGTVKIDVKRDGEHFTTEFDRRVSPIRAGNSTKAVVYPKGEAYRGASGGSWWRSLKSLVTGDRTAPAGQLGLSGDGGVDQNGVALAATLSGNPLEMTHVHFRANYPNELFACNAIGELFLIELDPLGGRGMRTSARWGTNIQLALGKAGSIVAMTDSRNKVCVLFRTQPALLPLDGVDAETRRCGEVRDALPALYLVTLAVSSGKVINYTLINTIAEVVSAVERAPRHHTRLYMDDRHSQVIFTVARYVVRINNQVGVHSPCSSDDTIELKGLTAGYGSVLQGDGSLVTLTPSGPRQTAEGLFNDAMTAVVTDASAAEQRAYLGVPGEGNETQYLEALLTAVRADPRLSLDTAVRQASEELATQTELNKHNWTRRDLNADDENIVLFVTRHLRRRQQSHRRFVTAVLEHRDVAPHLLATTIAQIISEQESLLALTSLRSLQNVGTLSGEHGDQYRQVNRPNVLQLLGGASPGSSGGADSGAIVFIQDSARLERCQQVLRDAIIAVAETLRSSGAVATTDAATGSPSPATAAEIAFQSPRCLAHLLRAMGESLLRTQRTVAVPHSEKVRVARAVACLYVCVAQAVAESRDDMAKFYHAPREVQQQLWTAAPHPTLGVDLVFAHATVAVSNVLAEALSASPSTDALPSTAEALSVFDLLSYLVHFCLTSHASTGDGLYASKLLRTTVLRAPFVLEPFGYPYGAPRLPPTGAAEVGRRALEVAEVLALHFDAADVLLAFSLATPVESPEDQPGAYERLGEYCQHNPRVFRFALDGLLRDGREWELLHLPAILCDVYPTGAHERDAFLEDRAPHLLWLVDAEYYHSLCADGATPRPAVPYGPTQLLHRKRALAVGSLAWVASGGAETRRYDELALQHRLVDTQERCLSPQADDQYLGPQELVQSLLALPSVEAWVEATRVACATHSAVAADLLVQAMRRCREHDGDVLLSIFENSASELETSNAMRETAVGQMVRECATLHNTEHLHRVCETVLSPSELKVIGSWMQAVLSGNTS